MRNVFVKTEFQSLWIDEDKLNFVRTRTVQDRHDQRIDADRFTRARRTRNQKVRHLCQVRNIVQSVDRLELALKLNQYATGRLRVFVEVELGKEETKSGVPQDKLPELMEQLKQCDHLEVRGLMAIPPFFDDPEKSRPFFARLRGLRDEYGLEELSMGMSHDFEVAIEEGATMVRVGTALFGARQ